MSNHRLSGYCTDFRRFSLPGDADSGNAKRNFKEKMKDLGEMRVPACKYRSPCCKKWSDCCDRIFELLNDMGYYQELRDDDRFYSRMLIKVRSLPSVGVVHLTYTSTCLFHLIEHSQWLHSADSLSFLSFLPAFQDTIMPSVIEAFDQGRVEHLTEQFHHLHRSPNGSPDPTESDWSDDDDNDGPFGRDYWLHLDLRPENEARNNSLPREALSDEESGVSHERISADESEGDDDVDDVGDGDGIGAGDEDEGEDEDEGSDWDDPFVAQEDIRAILQARNAMDID